MPRNPGISGPSEAGFANSQFLMAPLSPGYDFFRYDRELRGPFASDPQFAPESAIWRGEHAIGDVAEPSTPRHYNGRSDARSRQQTTIARGERA
jgi:hypothetical protein